MDYEKLHKDTIFKLQQMVNSGKITVETACGICADFIPESEDERIRYYLINFVKINDGINLPPDDAKKALAWLEKQGEQKPKFRVGDTIKCKHDDRQFTIKSVDSDKGIYTYTQEGCGNDIDYADEEFELVEQKPAWSEEDIELLDNTIKFIEDRVAATSPSLRTYSPTLTGKEIPFLKALKDRVQPKQEWSEEDKWMLQNILECLRHGWKKLPTDILKYESWLKSLRPQSQWKASDEQMQELHNVFNDTSAGWDDNVIESLYNDLKKLREG